MSTQEDPPAPAPAAKPKAKKVKKKVKVKVKKGKKVAKKTSLVKEPSIMNLPAEDEREVVTGAKIMTARVKHLEQQDWDTLKKDERLQVLAYKHPRNEWESSTPIILDLAPIKFISSAPMPGYVRKYAHTQPVGSAEAGNLEGEESIVSNRAELQTRPFPPPPNQESVCKPTPSTQSARITSRQPSAHMQEVASSHKAAASHQKVASSCRQPSESRHAQEVASSHRQPSASRHSQMAAPAEAANVQERQSRSRQQSVCDPEPSFQPTPSGSRRPSGLQRPSQLQRESKLQRPSQLQRESKLQKESEVQKPPEKSCDRLAENIFDPGSSPYLPKQPSAAKAPAEECPAEEPPAVEPPVEEPLVEEPPVEEPPVEEPPAEEPPAEEPAAEEEEEEEEDEEEEDDD